MLKPRKLLAVFAAVTCVPLLAFAEERDVLIRGGKIIDGTGNGWYYADLAITGDRIVAIGDLRADTAPLILDAKGLVVAPGFIDVHTHVDDDIYRSPLAENFVRGGVTTIVSGNCGGSVLDVAKFFERITKEPAALNHATLYGHNTVLKKVKGSVAGKLTPAQLDEGKALVAKAMADGAIGFSTGLIYTPGTWSDTDEIIELAKPAGAAGGIYATHMRSEGNKILDAIDEALRIGREAGMRVEISHFKLPVVAATALGRGTTLKGAGSDVTLAKVEAARRDGQEVWLDQYPYTASATTMNTLLPDWVLEKGPDEAKKILTDPAQLPKVLADMKGANEVRSKRVDMSYAVVSAAKGHPDLAGKNIKQVAQIFKLRAASPEAKELLTDAGKISATEVTMEDQYRAVIELYLSGGASGVFHSMDETEVTNILRHPLVAVASDSGLRTFGSGAPHPRGYGTNTRVLGRYVRELGTITLEDAIRKMTTGPALAFRLKDRGTLRPGAFADIVLFDPATVADQATFDNPHQYPVGIRSVLVNGQVVFDGQNMTGAKPGQPILGPGAKSTH